MKGSGAPGNRRRAAPRSPPCSIGAASERDIMAAALTLAALLIEIMLGYPDRLLRAIGHPVIWMGRVIHRLDCGLNRPAATPVARRMAGTIVVLILVVAVGAITFILERGLLLMPLGPLA